MPVKKNQKGKRRPKWQFWILRRLTWMNQPLAWIGGGWALAFFAVLALLNFHPIVKTELSTNTPLWIIWPLFLAGLGCMIRGYRWVPSWTVPDVGRKEAWIGLGIILSAGAFLRLYNLGHPPGLFWDDWATTLVWVHTILDKNQFFWMMPSDGIEPFNPYVITALQAVVPDSVKDVVVCRTACCLVDMAALWVLYLAGKELGSRRIGLLAAALGALGRPMIQLTITGMRAYTLSLAVGFLVLASLKMFRKPSLRHFLLWGLALAFGVHTYSSFRVFILILPFLLLPWVFQEGRKRGFKLWEWPAPLGATFLLCGVFSGTLAVTLPALQGWSRAWSGWTSQPWPAAAIFALGLLPAAVAAGISLRRGKLSPLAGWSLALAVASLLIFPLTLSDEFNGRMGVLSPFRDAETSRNIVGFMAGQVWQTLRSLFYACLDRNDLLIGTDPFYDLFSQGALLLGLAFTLARPGWKKGFLLAVAALGTVVYVISLDPASTKLIGSAPPLYLLAAWAVSRLWAGLPKPRPRTGILRGGILLSGLLAVYGIWGGWVQFGKLHGYWAKIPCVDTELARHVAEDSPRYRTYLAPSAWFFGWSAQFVLNEGNRYYILKDQNRIPVGKGEVPQDAVIYVYGSNATLIQSLHGQFPSAQWEKIFVFPHNEGDPNPELYMWRVFIPAGQLPDKPGRVLQLIPEEGACLRRYYSPFYGWGLSGILMEERTANFSDPLPQDRLESKMFDRIEFRKARLLCSQEDLNFALEGNYVFHVDYPGPLWFMVDGRTVWKRDTAGPGQVSFKARIEAGTHHLELRTRILPDFLPPVIHWRNGEDQEGKLL